MKPLKEIEVNDLMDSYYYDWYKDAIEWIFNDILNSDTTSVETIEKYLQDLLTK